MKIKVTEKLASGILTPATGFIAPAFTHSLNCYSGCQFSCEYCYCKHLTIQRTNPYGLPWHEWLDVKTNAPDLLLKQARRGKLRDARIYMSTVTDPYLPKEAHYCLTRGCLEVMVDQPPEYLVLQTRNVLVLRDKHVIRQIPRCQVNLTITTDDDLVRRIFEANCPSVGRRVQAAAELKAEGIRVVITISPLLPCNPESFARMLEPVCDAVILDNFYDGDGCRGKRSQRMISQLRENGFERWAVPGYQQETIEVFRRVLGHDRVLISQAGFNTLPDMVKCKQALDQLRP